MGASSRPPTREPTTIEETALHQPSPKMIGNQPTTITEKQRSLANSTQKICRGV
jgi:hypothetical protein